jgi:hypothetical protein
VLNKYSLTLSNIKKQIKVYKRNNRNNKNSILTFKDIKMSNKFFKICYINLNQLLKLLKIKEEIILAQKMVKIWELDFLAELQEINQMLNTVNLTTTRVSWILSKEGR